MKNLTAFSLFLFFVLSTIHSYAQKGHYISVIGGPQISSIINRDDDNNTYNPDQLHLTRNTTLRYAGGVQYYYNFSDFYGVQSGIYYSQEGQKYIGKIAWDFNTGRDSNLTFNSSILFNYIRIPLALRISAEMDEGNKGNLSLFFGLNLGIFTGVQGVSTTPPPHDSLVNRYPGFDFNDLYQPINLGATAGAQYNLLIKPNWGVTFGAKFDQSVTNIENLSAVIPKDAPIEWTFPVSTKKNLPPDLLVRRKTKTGTVQVFAGLYFKLNPKPSQE